MPEQSSEWLDQVSTLLESLAERRSGVSLSFDELAVELNTAGKPEPVRVRLNGQLTIEARRGESR